MITQEQVGFLQKKIPVLEQALFFTLSESVLRLPSSVIKALHVDEVGQVWFAIRRPSQQLSEFDREFPAKLDFYKKGEKFYLHLCGQAGMAVDPEEIYYALSLPGHEYAGLHNDQVLVRFKTTHFRYHSFPPSSPGTKKENLHWLFSPSAFFKTLQYIVKDVIPVFQSHRYPY